MSKHAVAAGNIAGLREWLAQLKEKAHARTGRDYQIITIQEAGLNGFWIHRVLQSECIEAVIRKTLSGHSHFRTRIAPRTVHQHRRQRRLDVMNLIVLGRKERN